MVRSKKEIVLLVSLTSLLCLISSCCLEPLGEKWKQSISLPRANTGICHDKETTWEYIYDDTENSLSPEHKKFQNALYLIQMSLWLYVYSKQYKCMKTPWNTISQDLW